MAKIQAEQAVAEFQRMLREHWSYQWGASKTGCVDCSGAFVWSWRQHGKKIYNGSNRIARCFVTQLIPVEEARRQGRLVPGMAAFKARAPGRTGYALPAGYLPGGKHANGDLNDYYHIGLVDEDTEWVLNAQSARTGFVRSRIKENWSCVAALTDVDYGAEKEETGMSKTATVTGGALRMRQGASKGEKVLALIPDGTVIEVTGGEGEWRQVRYAGMTGWVMQKYLTENQTGEAEDDTETVQITLGREDAERLMNALALALDGA